MAEPIRAVALLSGSGRTLANLLEHIDDGAVPAKVDLVVSSRADAYGLDRARERDIETALVESKSFRRGGKTDWDAMSRALDAVILPRAPALVVFAGFMCFYKLPPELSGKAINIHPALLPAFGGQGMYGHYVHEAALRAGVKLSGCTVHFVTNEYDAGPIILQRACPVYHDDTPPMLADRVFAEECEAYPEAVRLFAEGRLKIVDGVVEVKRRQAQPGDS